MNNEYTFTTETGWRVHEYRPFSASYAVGNSPCLSQYDIRLYARPALLQDSGQVTPAVPVDPGKDLLKSLTDRQLKFDYLAWEVVRQLVEERVRIRDQHRKTILGRITDVSGDIYRCYLHKTPEGFKQRFALEKAKLELEKQSRDEDLLLWRDVAELRQAAILNRRKYESTQARTGLVSGLTDHNGDKTKEYPMDPGYLPGPETVDRGTS